MRVYTAYEKAGPAGQGSDSDVILVLEGGSYKAMFFPLIWPLFHGMWHVLAGQLLMIAGLILAAILVPNGDGIVIVVAVVLTVLMGLHANDMRRWTLRLKGFSFTGIVAGTDEADAERRLFTALGPHIYLS